MPVILTYRIANNAMGFRILVVHQACSQTLFHCAHSPQKEDINLVFPSSGGFSKVFEPQSSISKPTLLRKITSPQQIGGLQLAQICAYSYIDVKTHGFSQLLVILSAGHGWSKEIRSALWQVQLVIFAASVLYYHKLTRCLSTIIRNANVCVTLFCLIARNNTDPGWFDRQHVRSEVSPRALVEKFRDISEPIL